MAKAKQTYAQRIAAGTQRYLAAHPGASLAEAKRAARGHGTTGEHGSSTHATIAGRDVYETRSAQEAKRLLGQIARGNPSARVELTVKDARTPSGRTLYAHRPGRHGSGGTATVEYLRKAVRGKNVKRWIESNGWSSHPEDYEDGEVFDGIDTITITVY